jgi:hypothetical protein
MDTTYHFPILNNYDINYLTIYLPKIMKNLKKDIKAILSNECLTIKEKEYLKQVFKTFTNIRSITSRKSINFEEEEEDDSICFGLDCIIKRN